MRVSLLAAAAFAVFVVRADAATEGPVYDQEGHLTQYVYADGSADRYVYDASWKMTGFVSKDGKRVNYSYLADGTKVESPVAKGR